MASLSAFESVTDLGIYCWNPAGIPTRRSFQDVTVEDVLKGVRDPDGALPDKIVSIDRVKLPVSFVDLIPQHVENVFPYDAGYIVPLFKAVQRGLKLEDIDFLLGGSSLNILAQKEPIENDTKYITQKCPGTDVILMCKHKAYTQNYAEPGFQFERLLTGRKMNDSHDLKKFEKLHVMTVGTYKVLFSADVDAVDDAGEAVEMKTGNPRFFGMKVMFQMMSSQSKTLIQGQKDTRCRPPSITSIRKRSLQDMMSEHGVEALARAQNNILEGLTELKNSPMLARYGVAEVDFSRGQIMLQPSDTAGVLPTEAVCKQLLQPAASASA
ncbi:unnamed protein product [Polarella glacialis]|uniref:Uncharacterized protein n=1 Tax=Polarella glacialis TaxID=89957 RepID=A0A813LVM1_POLGL|nr:unnamed protein product [Polarella glacialis]CAE8741089.1 unnamed protein product [Polarella glacialis]